MQAKKQNKLKQTVQHTGKRMLLFGIVIALLSGCAGCGQEKTELFLEESLTMEEEEQELLEENTKQPEGKENSTQADERETDAIITASCFVHICGAVENPGVYELPEGSRIFEVVEAAGGMTEEACGEYQNQAQKITDGMQIFVPTTEQAENGTAKQYFLQEETVLTEGTEKQDGRININTADKELLMTLPGIGESRAESILSYREENGSFANMEDIMKISGIKEGAYEKIKDKICIN